MASMERDLGSGLISHTQRQMLGGGREEEERRMG